MDKKAKKIIKELSKRTSLDGNKSASIFLSALMAVAPPAIVHQMQQEIEDIEGIDAASILYDNDPKESIEFEIDSEWFSVKIDDVCAHIMGRLDSVNNIDVLERGIVESENFRQQYELYENVVDLILVYFISRTGY